MRKVSLENSKKFTYDLVVPVPVKGIDDPVKNVEFCRLTSPQRRDLMNVRSAKNGEKVMTAMLSGVMFSANGVEVDNDAVAIKIAQSITTVDRELLAFKIREKTLGSIMQIEATLLNEYVRESIDITLDLSKIKLETKPTDVKFLPDGTPYVTIEFTEDEENFKLAMRVANGEDGEMINGLLKTNKIAAIERLRQRCCMEVNDVQKPTQEQMDDIMPPKAYDTLSHQYVEKVPSSTFETVREIDGEKYLIQMSLLEMLFSKQEEADDRNI